MVELEPNAALKAFNPASVTSPRSVCVCQQSLREPTRSTTHPPNTHTLATRCYGPAHKHTAPNRTTPYHTHANTPYPRQHTTLHTTTSTHRPRTPEYTTTHGPIHNSFTNHLYLHCSVTVVMVELELNAALNAFKPASVTLSSPVYV